MGLDSLSGAIVKLRNNAGKRDWASAANPLAAFSYQTLSKSDYDRFLASYITVQTDWAPKDFGKPNIESFGAQSKTWTTKLVKCFSGADGDAHRIVAHLEVENAGQPAPAVTAWPAQLYLELVLPKAEPLVHINFTWLGKRANRLPEAMWLTFNPVAPQARSWIMAKVEGQVSPFDVVSGGNRHMHALSTGITYQDDGGKFVVEPLDAPLAVLGVKSPIYFSNEQPDLSQGIHFSLFNNGWGTNYVQWLADDMRFRFTVRG
jgi:hypothetical protein